VVGSERSEASPAPEAAVKDISRGKAPAAASLSSASQLQQEWANTASSIEAGEKLKVQGSKLTLAELNKQFSIVKESLQNVGLQFLDAARTTNVSTAF
jgi:TPP-dependent indolepyruvate ferredoxin oxidoreductase alpha subunit